MCVCVDECGLSTIIFGFSRKAESTRLLVVRSTALCPLFLLWELVNGRRRRGGREDDNDDNKSSPFTQIDSKTINSRLSLVVVAVVAQTATSSEHAFVRGRS